ncbi:MAG: formate/nitrite transporter family protein [Candidatus Krumholzibacteriia bacterium]
MDDGKDDAGRRHLPPRQNVTVLEAEVRQAVRELKRPALGLMMSGLIAGFTIGTSVLAMLMFMEFGDHLAPLTLRLMIANAYAVGFVLVILSHTDLFTEYTTIALLPVFAGEAGFGSLARLWTIIFLSNLVGCFVFAAVLVAVSPNLEIASAETISEAAADLVGYPWWLMSLSAMLAGWLMGLLGWLVSSSQDTIGQIVFVWLIGSVIGLGNLHHSIVGALEMFAALLVAGPITIQDTGRFLFIVTLGNILGGALFAAIIRFSVLIIGEQGKGRSS